ncbi:hypothetical protein CHARACLAT_010949 [Characodon lateralis]|uniref:Uncharacterized protein n=1 Tax=Characodon lateralis TaxID=208331 RepID=A0ABU7CZL6_9TELE|nr:hypothetical protein [Characodon lateralis]
MFFCFSFFPETLASHQLKQYHCVVSSHCPPVFCRVRYQPCNSYHRGGQGDVGTIHLNPKATVMRGIQTVYRITHAYMLTLVIYYEGFSAMSESLQNPHLPPGDKQKHNFLSKHKLSETCEMNQ